MIFTIFLQSFYIALTLFFPYNLYYILTDY
jgi:hypothetical protein